MSQPDLTLHVHSVPTDNQIKYNDTPSTDSLEYLPWGTRSLKLKVGGKFRGECYLRPKEFALGETPVVGYADGLPQGEIQVSWGGGHIHGFKRGDEPYAYFNITHRGAQAAEQYTLTLQAYDSKRHRLLGEQAVTLKRPKQMPTDTPPPTWRSLPDGNKELLLAPARDRQVPIYLSRWWPTGPIQYVAQDVGAPPQVRLFCQRNVNKGYSQVEVYAAPAPGQPETRLACVDGDLQFPLIDLQQIDASLYYISGHWALRIWFFWLDTSLDGKIDRAGLSEAEKGVFDAWGQQEAPDAERVDILFDQAFNIRFLCTDLHWRELWAPFSGTPPVRISIAGEKMKDVLVRGSQGLVAVAKARLKKYAPRPDQVYDPSREVITQLTDPAGAHKGAGDAAHKHTPYFHDAGFDLDLISNDVLRG